MIWKMKMIPTLAVCFVGFVHDFFLYFFFFLSFDNEKRIHSMHTHGHGHIDASKQAVQGRKPSATEIQYFYIFFFCFFDFIKHIP